MIEKYMFNKHKVYYSIEVKDEDSFIFVCSYSTYKEAIDKLEELQNLYDKEYRILKVEKDIEEII